MAEPRTPEEWEIYNRLVEENKDDKGAMKFIEAAKADRKTDWSLVEYLVNF